MRSTWGPPGSSQPQMGPMLAPWTLLSGAFLLHLTLYHVENEVAYIVFTSEFRDRQPIINYIWKPLLININVNVFVCLSMMQSWNGNTIRITGSLRRESTGYQWFSFTKEQLCELWCFFDVSLSNQLNSRRVGELSCSLLTSLQW